MLCGHSSIPTAGRPFAAEADGVKSLLFRIDKFHAYLFLNNLDINVIPPPHRAAEAVYA